MMDTESELNAKQVLHKAMRIADSKPTTYK